MLKIHIQSSLQTKILRYFKIYQRFNKAGPLVRTMKRPNNLTWDRHKLFHDLALKKKKSWFSYSFPFLDFLLFFHYCLRKSRENALKTTVIIYDWSTVSISDYSTTVLQRLIQSPPFAHNGNFLMFKWFFIQSCTDFGGMIRSGSVCSAIYCLIFATNHAFSQAGWIIFMTMISIARLPSENGF